MRFSLDSAARMERPVTRLFDVCIVLLNVRAPSFGFDKRTAALFMKEQTFRKRQFSLSTPGDVIASMRHRAFSYFSKPFSLASLADIVRGAAEWHSNPIAAFCQTGRVRRKHGRLPSNGSI